MLNLYVNHDEGPSRGFRPAVMPLFFIANRCDFLYLDISFSITDCDFNNLHQNQISFVPFPKSYGAPFRLRWRHKLANSFKHLFKLSIILLLKGV